MDTDRAVQRVELLLIRQAQAEPDYLDLREDLQARKTASQKLRRETRPCSRKVRRRSRRPACGNAWVLLRLGIVREAPA